MKPLLCVGKREFIKQTLWGYCFERFDKEKIWIVDTLPIFDPYAASKANVERARQLLQSIRIARPFTFYQLRDKLFSLTKLRLDKRATVIVSGMDSYDEELKDKRELHSIQLAMLRLLESLGSKCIIGLKQRNETFGGVAWAGQSCR